MNKDLSKKGYLYFGIFYQFSAVAVIVYYLVTNNVFSLMLGLLFSFLAWLYYTGYYKDEKTKLR